MKPMLFPLIIVRLVLGIVFVALAGILALVADGVGKLGWLLTGENGPAPRRVPTDDELLELKLRARLISA